MVELSEDLELALEAIELGELGRIVREGDPDDFEALRELARAPETSSEHRRRALYALGTWSGREADATEAVRSVLRERDPDEPERVAAAAALGRIGTPDARDLLVELADDDAPDVRRQVVNALARVGDDAARRELRALAEADAASSVREHAAETVRRLEGAGADEGRRG
jgi:HEAT repeat protein